MPDLWERRTKASAKLESAQVKLIKFARQHRLDTAKQRAKLEAKKKPVPEQLIGPVNPHLLQPAESNSEEGAPTDPKVLGLADQLVPRSMRPRRRLKPAWAPFALGWLGIGEKIDTIDWARREIAVCGAGLEKSRAQLQQDVNTPGIGKETYPPLNSAFIHFNQQIAAHLAVQVVAHHQPCVSCGITGVAYNLVLHSYQMNKRYIEQSPTNVIWRNLSLNPYEKNVRQALSYSMTIGLILLWAFPGTLTSFRWPGVRADLSLV